MSREAAAYWIAPSSRATTSEDEDAAPHSRDMIARALHFVFALSLAEGTGVGSREGVPCKHAAWFAWLSERPGNAAGLVPSPEPRTDPDFIKSQDGRNTTLPALLLFAEHFLTFEFLQIHSNRQKRTVHVTVLFDSNNHRSRSHATLASSAISDTTAAQTKASSTPSKW
ncbi:hypothetical protein [Bradyrhizobium sp. RD5-C2]|uniref:hypothetical protein n=1 Tax=Bradyrhizobium sp. RD5-C2 TaxID=244562 RepID=UPI001CC6CCAA|nr:hypothetical protein [Bradyrhizobium sp. RD5-C2]